MQWSIRTKILAVLSVLLITAIFAYQVLAERVFREDKQLLVFDTNRSSAERLASGLESALRRVMDKMEVLSRLEINLGSAREAALAKSFFESDPELIRFQLVTISPEHQTDGRQLGYKELVSHERLKKLGLTLDMILLPKILSKDLNRVIIENISTPKDRKSTRLNSSH